MGQHHSNDCNNINYNNINTNWKINSKIIKQFKTEYLEKLKDYLKNSSGNNVSLQTFKGYSLNIFYKYRYNNFFLLIQIGYIILIMIYLMNFFLKWTIINDKNLLNIEKGILLKILNLMIINQTELLIIIIINILFLDIIY